MFQTRKTRPFIFERLLMGHKEANQTNKQSLIETSFYTFANRADPDQAALVRAA